MNRLVALTTAVVALVLLGASSSAGAPITKQNGSAPVFKDFTSICAVAGYADFGSCGGDVTKFTNVKGKINAIQPKPDRWNLGISFTGLEPGAAYRLWGNQDGATPAPYVVGGFFVIADGVADANGNLNFSYQTSNPNNLGFDLNRMPWNITIVTSYWSQQAIKVLNPDGTLYVPH
jgi:hypothetical protein